MKQLMDYVKVYDVFDAHFCDEVVQQLQDDWMKHGFYLHDEKKRISEDDDLYVSHQETEHSAFIGKELFKPLRRYIDDVDLPSLQGWDGYLGIRYNKYEVGQKMHWHADRVQQMFDGERKGIPTLSVVGLLNDDFEGGEFIMFEDEKISLKQGDILIFPSTFMYPHKVTQITKGVRYSFVSWVW